MSVFKNLQGRLKEHGYIRTAEQIKIKLRKLKRQYLKAKDHNSIGGVSAINCEFYEELDATLGTRDVTENISLDSQEEDESPDSAITIPEVIMEVSLEDATDTDVSDVNVEKTVVPAKKKVKNPSRDLFDKFVEYDRKEKEQLASAIREESEKNRLLLKELSSREMEHEAAMMKMFTEAIVAINIQTIKTDRYKYSKFSESEIQSDITKQKKLPMTEKMENLVERILRDIKVNFIKEPNIDEFDIIPVFNSRNKSPVIIEGTKFALEAWCIKILWSYCYQKLMDWKENGAQLEEGKVIQFSEMVLLINADISTVWNIRKKFIFNQITVDEEFRLCRLVLTRKPKSSEVFMHRRWLLKSILEHDTFLQLKKFEKLLADEMLLCSIAASKYANNYCAWSHREWVHENVASLDLKILLDDLNWNESHIQSSVSDYSGFRFRQFLLKHILVQQLNCQSTNLPANCGNFSEKLTVYELLKNEWLLVNGLMDAYRGHEALWYHRRFVIHCIYTNNLLEIDKSTGLSTSSASEYPQCKKTRKESSSTLIATNILKLDDEIEFICRTNDKESHRFINHYKRWLTYIFHINFRSD
ncbi:Protein prenyltransferase alpha subunit repeat-containing protein 1 [Chamberlinius hualienensis]